MVTIKIKKDAGYIPQQGTELASGYDLIAVSPPKICGIEQKDDHGNIKTGKYVRIDYIEYETGVYISPNNNFHTLVFPRSSISKYDLILANSIGLIDTDYRGQIICRFKYIYQPCNIIDIACAVLIDTNKIYKKGDKIAQLVVANRIPADFKVVESLDDTIRGDGGFGSTDDKKEIKIPEAIKSALTDIYNKTPIETNKVKYSDLIKERESKL